MKFKVGDPIKVKSVAGHSDIINAVGMIGIITHIHSNVPKNYYIDVEYIFQYNVLVSHVRENQKKKEIIGVVKDLRKMN